MILFSLKLIKLGMKQLSNYFLNFVQYNYTHFFYRFPQITTTAFRLLYFFLFCQSKIIFILGYDIYDNYGSGSYDSGAHEDIYVTDPNQSSWNEFKI